MSDGLPGEGVGREALAEHLRRLINDLAFAAPELWAMHIERRMNEAVDAALSSPETTPAGVLTRKAGTWWQDDCDCPVLDTDGDGCFLTTDTDEPTHLCRHCLAHAATPAGVLDEAALAKALDGLGYEYRRYGRGEADDGDAGESFGIASGTEVAQGILAALGRLGSDQ